MKCRYPITVRRLRLSTVGSLSILVVIGAMLLTPLRVAAQDPAGIATGDKSNVVDAGGNSFVVAEPMDKSAPDYADKKKAYDEYKAQTEKEPLAMKLADSVGHVRLATNFAWTLNTGYLVLFMQAGFALLTCGLVRKKNAGHLMMLNFAAYVFRIHRLLGRWLCISVWSGGRQRRPGESGGRAQSEQLPCRRRAVGFCRR